MVAGVSKIQLHQSCHRIFHFSSKGASQEKCPSKRQRANSACSAPQKNQGVSQPTAAMAQTVGLFVKSVERDHNNMKKVNKSMFWVNIILVVMLGGCAFVSTPASPTPYYTTPFYTSTDVYYVAPDRIASLDFQFTIAEVLLDDTVKIMSGKASTAHKAGLIDTPKGRVPVNATGDSVLILHFVLTSGDRQKFLSFEPKILEDNIEKSPVEVITEGDGNDFYWIYDVNRSSRSFVLKLPNGSFDLQPTVKVKIAP